MPLSSGTRLGPYEIVAFLGAGGMGEVYRAIDVRLDRQVAVKIIAPGLHTSARLRERFEREARSIAALSHPHICTLHDIGHQDGIDYLVMEHLEGQTLAARLTSRPARSAATAPARDGSASGSSPAAAPRVSNSPSRFEPLPLDDTLRIATEFADALTAAHRAGVVHRDLKPGNLMLTKRGVVVLDFGLAKLTTRRQEDAHAQSTTDTAPLTNTGGMLGTLPYMAPEQLEGREADARTDIFAFGAIVYEMLTGRRAFAGDSQASLIAAILEREPSPASMLEPATPPGLDRLVRKCLAKDPEARWQSASDIADELRWIAGGSGHGHADERPSERRSSRTAWIALAAAAVILVVIAIKMRPWMTFETARRPEAVHRQITHSGEIVMAAMAPDARMIAYVTGDDDTGMHVYVRDMEEGQAVEILRRRLVTDLVWMPDGSRVIVAGVVNDSRGAWLIPRLGGEAQRLRSEASFDAAYVTIAPDGSSVALTSMDRHGFQVLTMDGQRQPPVRLEGFQWTNAFEWTAGGRIALLTVDTAGAFIVWTVTPAGDDLRRLHVSNDPLDGLCSSPDGRDLYTFRHRNEAAELLRLRTDSVKDDPGEVVLGGLPVTYSSKARLDCSVSRDGERLLYSRGSAQANLWKVEIDKPGAMPSPITRGTALLGNPSVSPDGRWIAAAAGTDANSQIVRLPIGGGEPVRLRAGGPPAWSPDGTKLAFVAAEGGSQRVWVSDPDGQGATQVPGAAPANPFVTWLPDGRLAWPTSDATDYRIGTLGDTSRAEEGLQGSEPVGWIVDARFSPRGDQVAVHWNRDKHVALWLITWPARKARELTRDLWPIGWSPDGDWIYAHNEKRNVYRISSVSGKSEAVATFPSGTLEFGCDLTPDRRTLICAIQEQHSDAWLAEHFDPRNRAARK